jgi:hypothetical protein
VSPTVKTIDLNNPKRIYVSLGVVTPSELELVSKLIPELHDELSSRWRVREIRFSRRNPFDPTTTETAIVIALATPILKAAGEQLAAEALKWLRRRFTPKSKKGKRKRTAR